ncbi:MAG: helix-turn-helix domain-containing protein [Verrucomicrobiota bacterium]|nr:helix-turn-helix domain-containing protein [Limisphaera sp.]MDW8380875.1 helix-turn-helix domain-containing protein [Verrucomicrobiota bacterium]
MASVGEQLRARREALGLTLHELAAVTKIRADLLRALEEGRYEVFRAPVYVKGSVRNYAQALKLDPVPLLRLLDTELAQDERLAQPPSLSPNEPTWLDRILFRVARLSWPHLVLIVLLLFWASLWIARSEWVASKRNQRALQGFVPTVYEGPSPTALEVLSIPEATQSKN